MNYKMVIQYDGTRYAGWQRQGNTDNTIQQKIEQILSQLLLTDISIDGSGRTDAGVHALGQVASFHAEKPLDCKFLLNDLNKALPGDIAVTQLEPAPSSFHARLSAKSKTYRYTVWNSPVSDVFGRRFQYQFPEPLDIAAMEAAASRLAGRHDFYGFSSGHTKKSTIRTLFTVQIRCAEPKVEIFFTGDGFLYNMARILTGTLLEVGLHKRDPEQVDSVFSNRCRQDAGFTAPPRGLCLMHVNYETSTEQEDLLC